MHELSQTPTILDRAGQSAQLAFATEIQRTMPPDHMSADGCFRQPGRGR